MPVPVVVGVVRRPEDERRVALAVPSSTSRSPVRPLAAPQGQVRVVVVDDPDAERKSHRDVQQDG